MSAGTRRERLDRGGGKGNRPRRVVVTGGSGGIGRSIVRHFLAEKAQVLNLDQAPLVLRGRSAARCRSLKVDLLDVEAIRAAFLEADSFFGGSPPDAAILAAAIGANAHVLDAAPEDSDRLMAVNVRGTMIAAQEAARRMVSRGRGNIVVITSISAQQGWAGEPLYCASKAAQGSLVQCLAVELGPLGVLVNAVGPGPVEVRSRRMSGNRAIPGVLEHYLDRIPLGRLARPEEVAEAAWFLSNTTYITGQTLYVDGGFLATGLAYISPLRATAARHARRASAPRRRGS